MNDRERVREATSRLNYDIGVGKLACLLILEAWYYARTWAHLRYIRMRYPR